MTTQNFDYLSSKAHLRKLARLALDRLTVEEYEHYSTLLVEKLGDYLVRHFPKSNRIAIYSALPHEPDLSALLTRFPERQFFYPRVVNDTEMNFFWVTSPSTLVTGTYGIAEPDPSIHSPVEVEDIDLVIVPGVAFDLRGNRLGHGKGYYDRFLEQIPITPTIGVGYGSQLVPKIPAEDHDRQMAYLATNRGVIPI